MNLFTKIQVHVITFRFPYPDTPSFPFNWFHTTFVLLLSIISNYNLIIRLLPRYCWLESNRSYMFVCFVCVLFSV